MAAPHDSSPGRRRAAPAAARSRPIAATMHGSPAGVMTVMCGGRRCQALGTAGVDTPTEPRSLWAGLRAAVARSRGGVLVRTEQCMGLCVLAPVVAVAPIRSDGATDASVTMGPMADTADIAALVHWITSGARPVPQRLRKLVVRRMRP